MAGAAARVVVAARVEVAVVVVDQRWSWPTERWSWPTKNGLG